MMITCPLVFLPYNRQPRTMAHSIEMTFWKRTRDYRRKPMPNPQYHQGSKDSTKASLATLNCFKTFSSKKGQSQLSFALWKKNLKISLTLTIFITRLRTRQSYILAQKEYASSLSTRCPTFPNPFKHLPNLCFPNRLSLKRIFKKKVSEK
jgi:hypothetical protein